MKCGEMMVACSGVGSHNALYTRASSVDRLGKAFKLRSREVPIAQEGAADVNPCFESCSIGIEHSFLTE